jgi:hypothetical protein
VAIEILPSEIAQSPDRLARFRQEAQPLAALNHLHIASIYGLEDIEENRSWSWSWPKARIYPIV